MIAPLTKQTVAFPKNPYGKLFWIVLTLKICFSFAFGSYFINELFIPFIQFFCSSPAVDPWQHFWSLGLGNMFPYSAVMLIWVALPKLILSLLGWQNVPHALDLFLVKLPLLISDLVIFNVLSHWFPKSRKQVTLFYWASPILIFISYIHGQLDAIPTAFLFLALFFLFRKNLFYAGLSLGIGIAAKAHLLIAVPFFLIYVWKNAGKVDLRLKRCSLILSGLLLASPFIVVPLIGSEGYRQMVLGTPEVLKFFTLALPFSKYSMLYIAPAAILLLSFRFIATPRINRDFLILFLGLIYSVLIVLVPPMPGWYFWSIPLAVYFFISHENTSSSAYWLVSSLYLAYFGLLDVFNVWGKSDPLFTQYSLILNLIFTALQTSAAFMVYWIYCMGLKGRYGYQIRLRPVCVGIGGDSGAGKDRLTNSLRGIVGSENSAQNNGDDYHRWSRNHENWSMKTHLNPEANHMLLPLEHLQDLKHWKAVKKRAYDHITGNFNLDCTLSPKPFLFHVGLHPFYIRRMREMFDLKIYLDPHPDLRKYWKVLRDQGRGHSIERTLKQIEQRQSDAEKFIVPQREFADWIVQYLPLAQIDLTNFQEQSIQLKSVHSVRNDINLESVARLLSEIPTLSVNWTISGDLEKQTLEVVGSISSVEVKTTAFTLVPNAYEIIGNESIHWFDDAEGVTQILFLCIVKDVFDRRFAERSVLV